MLDKLPVKLKNAVEDGLLAFVGSFLGFFFVAIVTADGVTTLDWTVVPAQTLDKSVVATAGYLLFAYLVPLNKRFGIGSKKDPEAL